MDPVPLLDLKAQFAPLREEIGRAVNEVVEAQAFILGPPVERLEEEVARYVGAEHAVGCASGTDALILSLAALGVGPGDEVLTSPFSFFSTRVLRVQGRRPPGVRRHRPADVQPRSGEGGRRDRARAPARCCPCTCSASAPRWTRCREIAARAADCPSSRTRPRRSARPIDPRAAATSDTPGRWATPAATRSSPRRTSAASATAAWSSPSDAELAERLRLLRVHGGQQMYHHRWVGWNSRLDALQAAVLRVKLPHLDRLVGGPRGQRRRATTRWFARERPGARRAASRCRPGPRTAGTSSTSTRCAWSGATSCAST